MNTTLLLMSLVPLIGINVWHSLLLRMPLKGSKPHTISHHAVSDAALLKKHRTMHSLTSIALIVFAIFFLVSQGYYLAGTLLILAGIFDVLEVATLNKSTASEITAVNYHAVTAWIMALSYLLYATAIIHIAGLSVVVTAVVWVSFAILLTIAVVRKFKSFWITQHIYFCFLAGVIALAHVILIKN